MKKKLVVLTGAGISAESGLSTFRDSGGLWDNYEVANVASIEGWERDPQLVLDFYNKRRAELKNHNPNKGHYLLKELEEYFDVYIITQNVDNFHERAASKSVLHLHGELTQMRSEKDEMLTQEIHDDIYLGDIANDGAQFRPDIVWFGEAVPKMEEAIKLCQQADYFLVVGTSLQVYPAASLIDFVPKTTKIYIIDPKTVNVTYNNQIEFIKDNASAGIQYFKDKITSQS